jgi:hypothetical protein
MNTFKLSLAVMLFSAVAFTSCKKKGCMDEAAVNYDEKAKKDDGSCNYKPIITIVGANPATVYVGSTYNDAGATAFVKNSGPVDVTTDLSNVNTSQTGSFIVTYTASNTHGTSTATRLVNVILGQSSYLGSFSATNSCGATDLFPHTSNPQVVAGNGPNQVKIENAFNIIGGNIVMNIDQENITVPSTSINLPLGAGTLNFTGSGTMNNTGTSMVVNYSYTRTGLLSGSGTCTVTYTR